MDVGKELDGCHNCTCFYTDITMTGRMRNWCIHRNTELIGITICQRWEGKGYVDIVEKLIANKAW